MERKCLSSATRIPKPTRTGAREELQLGFNEAVVNGDTAWRQLESARHCAWRAGPRKSGRL